MNSTQSPPSAEASAGKHLSDDQLIAVCVERAPEPRELRHLERCSDCEQRRAGIVRILTDFSDAAIADADRAFPNERLARQRARILQRIEQEVRHARVIAFPAGHANEPPPLRARPGMRWMAGAAAAGLVIGLLAGYVTHDVSGTRSSSRSQAVAVRPEPAAQALRAVPTTLSEEEFLGRLEIAIEGSSASALRPLDDLTPRVWEVAAR